MKRRAAFHMPVFAALLGLAVVALATPTFAGNYAKSDVRGAINHVLYDVIYRTAETARDEVYEIRYRRFEPSTAAAESRLGTEARLDLQHINAAHDEAVANLETKFYRRLERLADGFEYDAMRAHKKFSRDLIREDREYCDLRAPILGTD